MATIQFIRMVHRMFLVIDLARFRYICQARICRFQCIAEVVISWVPTLSRSVLHSDANKTNVKRECLSPRLADKVALASISELIPRLL